MARKSFQVHKYFQTPSVVLQRDHFLFFFFFFFFCAKGCAMTYPSFNDKRLLSHRSERALHGQNVINDYIGNNAGFSSVKEH